MHTMYKYGTYAGIVLALCMPTALFAATENVGFVDGIWYAHNPVFADTPTRIYVAFRNNTPSDVRTTVRFSDNGKRIGSATVQALSGRLIEAWVDWTPTYGSHTLTVSLSNTVVLSIGAEPQTINTNDIFIEEVIDIDRDTDGDHIGDKEDTDDDNDGVTDTEEKERGSNPLVANPTTQTPAQEKTSSKKLSASTESNNTASAIQSNLEGNRGLEQYTDHNITQTLLGNVTEKVNDAKRSLDAYRDERNTQLYQHDAQETSSTSLSTSTPVSIDTATITRSKIEKQNNTLLVSFIEGVRSIFQNIWTLILFLLSQALAHPALIQILLLLGILCIIYYLLRRVGRRPM